MNQDYFWKQILLLPMSKNKMASVENYMRIVINIQNVKYHNTPVEKKMTILNLLLFELLIYGIFHFLRRLIFLGKKAKDAITPPSSYNSTSSLNEETQHGGIGERLIHYIFNVYKIVFISYAAAKTFETLELKDEKEIQLLKNIILKEDTSYATFTFTEIIGIVHKMHNCCCKSDF